MKKSWFISLFFILGILTIILNSHFLETERLLAQETGNVCVRDYQPGANCTANDVRIEELIPVTVIEACNEGVIGEVEVIFDALVSASGSPNRYDVGIYLDTSGTFEGALSGDACYHDYLSPPLTSTVMYTDSNMNGILDNTNGPWWIGDGDMCGDIETNTELIKRLPPLRLACADADGDPLGAADIHVCTSWDNNANTACTDVTQAFPGTNSKCGCSTINFEFTPTVVTMFGMGTDSDDTINGSLLYALTFLGLLTSLVLIWRSRNHHHHNES